ncbi:MAG TPA: formimidoylglutamate deiminase [Thermohalobaculum sp.]|nr:formimidoylglutamate deiminase [Thermohalobaculum sp.]
MTTLFAERALLPEGWAESVRVTVGPDGRIAAVEEGAAARAGDERLTGRILLPAPGNLHSHAFQRAMAGMTEGRNPAGSDSFWTWRELMYRFLEALTPDDVEAIAAMVQVEMAEAGYAAVAEFHYLHNQAGGGCYDDPAELSARIMAAAATTGLGLTLLPVAYVQGGCDGRSLKGGQLRFSCDIDRLQRILDGVERAAPGLPADTCIGVAPHSLRAVPPGMVAEVARLRPGDPVHIHAAEQTAEVAEVRAAHGARPVALLLDRVGVDARWCLVHCTHMDMTERTGLARSGAVAGLCPITESSLGDGIFDGAAYRRAGGLFGVGSDSNIRISLSEELRTLEYSQRLRDRARAVLAGPRSTGRTLFDAALAGSARALGRDAGGIEAGRLADLVALDAQALELVALEADMALDGWIFAGDDRAVADVWSAGRRLVTGGRHFARDPVEPRFRATLARLRDAA